jgi:hypothetical protein
MVIGNVAEFWIFTDLLYEGEGSFIRNISWPTYLFGTLLMFLASAIAGFARSPLPKVGERGVGMKDE